MVRENRKEHYWFTHFTENIEDYAIVRLNETGEIIDWNKGAENIKGYKAEEIIGKNFTVFYTDNDLQKQVPQKLIEQAKKKTVKLKVKGGGFVRMVPYSGAAFRSLRYTMM